jgi:acyl-[acyl carrier protein]--UDP-N-acetylglucosamine O-acyltransferase
LPAGIHPAAVVSPTAKVDAAAHIGAGCVIGDRVRI